MTPGFCPLCATALAESEPGYRCPNHGQLLVTITRMGPEAEP